MKMFSIGADPELFVSNNGRPSSAIGKLGGSKHAPRMVDGYGIQEDNVLAEFSMPAVNVFNFVDPARRFCEVVQDGVRTVRDELRKHKLSTTKHTSHKYSPRTLKKYGPSALEFGCDPDMNAYTGKINPAPDKTSTLRTAGGHVHVGYTSTAIHPDTARLVAKAMDLFLGVPSVLLDPDNRRRELYGKAGAYREKSYGIEYRSLSNFWIHDNALIEWVFYQSQTALQNVEGINLLMGIVGEQAVQDCINTGDVELARHIVQTYNINLPRGVQHEQAA